MSMTGSATEDWSQAAEVLGQWGPPLEIFRELRSMTDLALRVTKMTARSTGRTMGSACAWPSRISKIQIKLSCYKFPLTWPELSRVHLGVLHWGSEAVESHEPLYAKTRRSTSSLTFSLFFCTALPVTSSAAQKETEPLVHPKDSGPKHHQFPFLCEPTSYQCACRP